MPQKAPFWDQCFLTRYGRAEKGLIARLRLGPLRASTYLSRFQGRGLLVAFYKEYETEPDSA